MLEPQRKYTMDEYWRLVEAFPEYRYEYNNGDVRMMAGGSPVHGQIALNIAHVCIASLYTRECNVYSSDVALQLVENCLYYPDLSISCDPIDWTRKRALESPCVVVEVTSPATERIDKVEKLEVYQLCSTIQDILFVDSLRCQVQHYHRVDEHRWEETFCRQMTDKVELSCIEVTIMLQEMYHKAYLA